MKRSICYMSLIWSHIAHRRVVKCHYFNFDGQNSSPTKGCLVWLYVAPTTSWETPPSVGGAEIRKLTQYFSCFIFSTIFNTLELKGLIFIFPHLLKMEGFPIISWGLCIFKICIPFLGRNFVRQNFVHNPPMGNE